MLQSIGIAEQLAVLNKSKQKLRTLSNSVRTITGVVFLILIISLSIIIILIIFFRGANWFF
jgi:hypothetical protein